jgi:glyoxylase-like metal-dependent hydrolase (beta-lactamase superfamily II)
MAMEVVRIKGSIYMIDAGYHGQRGVLSTYVAKGEKTAIVDPGPTASIEGVLRGLEQLSIDLEEVGYIAPTHIHLDHAGGSWKLLERCSNAKLYVHPRGAPHMVDPSRLVESARGLFGDRVNDYGEVRGIPEDRIVNSSDGEALDLGGAKLITVWTPGHASHHQSYYVPGDSAVILGDAGGIYNQRTNNVTPTSPPPFNPEQAMESLEKLIVLKPEIACYGHFGFTEDAVKRLRTHKEQLALWVKVVSEGLKEGLGMRELYERLSLEDPMLRSVPTQRLDERLEERSPSTNLTGFVEYFRWLWAKKNQ